MIFGALRFIARELLDRAEEELYDDTRIHAEMAESYALLEAGVITEPEFERREQLLMDRLDEIEERRSAAARDGDGDEEDDEDEDEEDEEEDEEDEEDVEDREDQGGEDLRDEPRAAGGGS